MGISAVKCMQTVCVEGLVLALKKLPRSQGFFYQSSCIDSISKDTGCFIPSSVACLEPCLSSALQRMFPDVNIQRLNTIFGFLGCGWHLSISKCVFAFQTGGALN